MEINIRKDYIDGNKNRIFRNSAGVRIVLGTIACTGVSVLYACAYAKYKKLDTSFIINWLKGSALAGFGFYTSNEALFALSKYHRIYTNFWINYTLTCLWLSKAFYRFLIRNNIMKWYNAIRYSHKCFLYLCVINLIFEFGVYLFREVQLYDDEDIFDTIREKFMRNGLAECNFTYRDLEENFMKSFHVLNSPGKVKDVKRYMKDNPNNSKINTLDLYEYYKGNNIK
jgi:hypothetical protein